MVVLLLVLTGATGSTRELLLLLLLQGPVLLLLRGEPPPPLVVMPLGLLIGTAVTKLGTFVTFRFKEGSLGGVGDVLPAVTADLVSRDDRNDEEMGGEGGEMDEGTSWH